MTTVDMSTAPDAVFAARIAPFEAAPVPEEVLREKVAAAISCQYTCDGEPHVTDVARRYADAALAVFRDQPDPRLARVLALLSSDGVPLHDSKRIAVGRIRAAVAGTE